MQLHYQTKPAIVTVLRPGFSSFKTTAPITFSRRSSRDALIQATLDRHISEIFPAPELALGIADAYFSFGVTICGKRCLVILCDATHGTAIPAPPGFQLALTIGRSHTLADQIVTTSRMIWSHRQRIVSSLFEMRFVELVALRSDGVAVSELHDLLAASARWLDSALALVCRGRVHLGAIDTFSQVTRFYSGPHLKER